MNGSTITRWVRFLGLAVVLAAAAVLSFHGLRDLALAVSIPAELAWLLPVAVDAGAGVSCACWLSRDIPADAARFARTQTWLLLGGTVIGNAAQLGMHASGIVPPWWVAVLVGAIPPAVVGGTIHLAVLVGRPASPTAAQEDPIRVNWPTDEELEAHLAESIPAAKALFGEHRAEQAETWPPAGGIPDRRAEVDVDRDGAVIDDLRAMSRRHGGRQFARDDVKIMYGMGSPRASRLLTLLGWMPRDVERAEQAEGVGG